MRKYFLLADRTSPTGKATIRLVDNTHWLESRYVTVIKEYKARNYMEASAMARTDGYEDGDVICI